MTDLNVLTVSGQGAAAVVPDQLDLRITVAARKDTLQQAFTAASETVDLVLARLAGLGVPKENIGTTGLNIQPEQPWHDGVAGRITGYVVSSDLGVRLKMGDDSQGAIEAVVQAGGDRIRINGLEKSCSDPSNANREARERAWDDAVATANQLATLAGRTLGPVLGITDGASPAGNFVHASPASRVADASMRIEPGQGTVNARLTVTWELA